MLGPALVNVCPIGESLNFLKLSANIPANFLAVLIIHLVAIAAFYSSGYRLTFVARKLTTVLRAQ